MSYKQMTKEELIKLREELLTAYEEKKGLGLNLSMARGKPEKGQLELSMPMLNIINEDTQFIGEDGLDLRNYGVLSGTREAKRFFADILDVG
ncbi:MAG: aminotransferase, partial [Candidatus Ornithomonoglobus sp.]